MSSDMPVLEAPLHLLSHASQAWHLVEHIEVHSFTRSPLRLGQSCSFL
jgi:hypothetical protein